MAPLALDGEIGQVLVEVEERGPGHVAGEIELAAAARRAELPAAVDEAVAHGEIVSSRGSGYNETRMRRRFLVGGGALVVGVAGAAAAAALLAWPAPSLGASESALAHVGLPNLAGSIARIRVTAADGTAVPVRVQDGELWPLHTVAQGERLTVEVSAQRPLWAGWLVGRTVRRTFTVTTPSVGVRTRFLRVRTGSQVTIPLDAPAAVLSVDGMVRRLGTPAVNAPAGIAARGRAQRRQRRGASRAARVGDAVHAGPRQLVPARQALGGRRDAGDRGRRSGPTRR